MWHGCCDEDDIRELSACNHDDDDADPDVTAHHLTHMSALELMALRKLCLLHLTALMETYSPLHQTASNW